MLGHLPSHRARPVLFMARSCQSGAFLSPRGARHRRSSQRVTALATLETARTTGGGQQGDARNLHERVFPEGEPFAKNVALVAMVLGGFASFQVDDAHFRLPACLESCAGICWRTPSSGALRDSGSAAAWTWAPAPPSCEAALGLACTATGMPLTRTARATRKTCLNRKRSLG